MKIKESSANDLSQIESFEERETIVNWENLLEAIKDGYDTFRGVSHGVQKDLIQNSWDAMTDKKKWGVTFELVEKKGITFFVMTDKGTTGMTGRVLKKEEMEKEIPENERWARFESMAFTKGPTTGSLGSRGRGKFIFVASSANKVILYDTLRGDGIYRLGRRRITKTGSPILYRDGDAAIEMLKKETKGLIKPLKEIGTRVIIVNPTVQLIRDVKSGRFLRYVEETWWELISKNKVKINLIVGGKKKTAKAPKEFILPEKDSKTHKIWIRKDAKIAGTPYGIKKLHIISRTKAEAVPSDIRGIAMQRAFMKICSLIPPYMPKDIAQGIYGFVTFNKKTEKALREAENPEHYWFDFRRAAPSAIRRYIEEELEKFAREKLGLGAHLTAARMQHQRRAEQQALYAINLIARQLGIKSIGPGGRRNGIGGPREWKDIRIQLPDLKMPREEDLRVNYNETVEGISCRAINDSNTPVEVKMKMFIRHQKPDGLITTLVDKDIRLGKNSKSEIFGPFKVTFTKKEYPKKGKHSVAVVMVSIGKKDKGKILDTKIKSFYLEETPPRGGIFEKCEGIPYGKKSPEIMGQAISGETKGYILQYNLDHPAYSAVEDDEKLLAEYLFRIMAHELCAIDLRSDKPVIFEKGDKDDPDRIMMKLRRKIGEFMSRYYA